jgi:endoglycosylceramidase
MTGRGRALGLVVLGLAAAAHADHALTVDGRVFRDRQGRTVVLRGFNVAGTSKTPPFLPFDDYGELDRLPALGANVIRLVFIWEAYEPRRDRFDELYLARLLSIARAAVERGLLVIVDVHQDMFSRYNADGCGDGFPRWLLPDDVPRHAPDNGAACRYWSTTISSSPDVTRSFAALYANEGGRRDRYLSMLDRVVRAFARVDGVIGFDVFNEPVGDEHDDVSPLYADAARVVAAAAPDALVFVEPNAALLGLGVRVPRLELPRGRIVFAPHFYDWPVVLSNQWTGSRRQIARAFELMRQFSSRWNVPIFVGEYGVPANAGRGGAYVDAVVDAMDALGASGAQWCWTPRWSPVAKDGWNREDYSIVDDQGRTRANFRRRPYPQRIAGELRSFSVDDEGALTMRWRNDARPVDSELFAPRSRFGDAPRISASAALDCRYRPGGLVLRCRSPFAGEMSARIAPQR